MKQTKAALIPHLMRSTVLKVPALSAVDNKDWTADMQELHPPSLPCSCRYMDKLCRSHGKPDGIWLYFEYIFVISLITIVMWRATQENLVWLQTVLGFIKPPCDTHTHTHTCTGWVCHCLAPKNVMANCKGRIQLEGNAHLFRGRKSDRMG